MKNTTTKRLFYALIASLFILLSAVISLSAYKPVSASADTAVPYAAPSHLGIKLDGKSGSTLQFTVINPNDYPIEVEYNTNTCNSAHAKEWVDLENLTTLTVAPRGSITAYVTIVGTVRCVAFSYVAKDFDQRMIVYATDYNSSKKTISLLYTSVVHFSDCLKVQVAGTGWKINVFNPTDKAVQIEYNKKMCFKEHAANWNLEKLKDLYTESDYLPAGVSTQITISTNGTATAIAVSYVLGNTRYITYAYNLSTSKSITVKTNVIPV